MDFINLQNFLDHLTEKRTVGCAVEVRLEGKTVYRGASGYSDLENKIPMTGDELFNIYSCSKLTTVTAGAQLLEQGKFLLSDPLYEYMPEFRDMNVRMPDGTLRKAEHPITVGDLFTMTAGFSYDLSAPGFQKAREVTGGTMDTVETIRCVAEDPLLYDPGTHWGYSIGHDVLAALVSVISGQKFRDYAREQIFEPLGMKETCYHHTEETLKRTAQQYRFVSDQYGPIDDAQAQRLGGAWDGWFENIGKQTSFTLGEEYDSGGAGIITSVADYSELMAALANGGRGTSGERILSPYTIDLMRTDRLTEAQRKDYMWPQLRGYGYGLGVCTHINRSISGQNCSIGEFGWAGAAGALSILDPAIGLSVFFAQHTMNPRESYFRPRLRNVVYSCLD